MKDKIKFKDETVLEIEDGASISAIEHIALSEDAAIVACKMMTKGNVRHIEFVKSETGEVYGIYDSMTLAATPTRSTNENGTVTVLLSLREMTDVEIQIEKLEESQETQNEAIDALIMGREE
ncbi:hypothetical protein J2S20_002329 [Moryella indoligenes]|uniref:Uncharacterized protein n=1 Tax=Moryella indoligenes TaxID=371674 RepID=A0AAE4AL34_9FIRM|nr:hypothetical protein [Moryella indoligenes]MDQ0153608.1 hypothetical protein [Moryella indoligenes]